MHGVARRLVGSGGIHPARACARGQHCGRRQRRARSRRTGWRHLPAATQSVLDGARCQERGARGGRRHSGLVVLSRAALKRGSDCALTQARAHELIRLDLPRLADRERGARSAPGRVGRIAPCGTWPAAIVPSMRPRLPRRARALLQPVRLHACRALREALHLRFEGHVGTSRALRHRRARAERHDRLGAHYGLPRGWALQRPRAWHVGARAL
mmetsp:Transcript_1748/g.4455  ORF Transcript_1748/g.4455 Transcript_1748/m.4455 type:complete len:213 (-) Transcript_1748:521-1159(-)